jgi:rRNA maturation protein Rpf1
MSLEELRSRLLQSGAKIALIVSIWKGNPRTITFLYPTDVDVFELRIESAALRREISDNKAARIHSVYGVTVEKNCSLVARELASILASILSVDVKDEPHPVNLGEAGIGMAEIRVTDLHGSKLLWTCYHARNGSEIGPRIRVSELRRVSS